MSRWPLVDFIVAMQACPTDKLIGANVQKVAEKYGIDPNHALGYIRLEMQNRGLGNINVKPDQG